MQEQHQMETVANTSETEKPVERKRVLFRSKEEKQSTSDNGELFATAKKRRT